jgi:carbon-monoxide dehydrogenase medium subunit
MLRGVKEYVRAGSVDDAVRFLSEHDGAVSLLAGGTDLLLVDRAYDTLLDISRLDLDYVREEGDLLRIGATTSIESIFRSPVVAEYADGILVTACRLFGTLQIRNMATIGGNVANAMPAADPPSALLALDACLAAVSHAGEREIPLDAFFTGPRKTVLRPDEMIRELRIPRAFRAWRGRWKKIGRVFRDIALANCGVSLRLAGGAPGAAPAIDDARIALCAVAPAPLRVRAAEDLLRARSATPALLDEAAAAVRAAVRPISDVRASEAYRRHVSGVIVRRSLAEICGLADD